jgi:hypothetical protein
MNPYVADKNIFDANGNPSLFHCETTPIRLDATLREGEYWHPSGDKKNKHLLNPHIYRMTNAAGNDVLQAVRSGNTRGHSEATWELIALMLTGYLQRRNGSVPGQGTESDPYIFSPANVQLLTKGIGGNTEEISTQRKALQDLKGKTIGVKIPDEKIPGGFKIVYVNFKDPLLFNFGCNLPHYLLRSVPGAGLLMGGNSENTEAFRNLFGKEVVGRNQKNEALQSFYKKTIGSQVGIDPSSAASFFDANSPVGKYLQDRNNDLGDRRAVLQLAAQILSIWHTGGHNNNPADPYAIQARLIVLLYKLGYVPSVNCLSGKDRTGVTIAAASALAAEIDVLGNVPAPYGDPDIFSKANRSGMIDGTGVCKITENNTGFRGAKIIENRLLCSGFKPSERYGHLIGASSFAKG